MFKINELAKTLTEITKDYPGNHHALESAFAQLLSHRLEPHVLQFRMLRSALEFYATPENWLRPQGRCELRTVGNWSQPSDSSEFRNIDQSDLEMAPDDKSKVGGKHARAALKATPDCPHKQDANERIKAAFPEMEPSGGHDYVDEIIGLLKIARMHTKDAEDRCQRLAAKNTGEKTSILTDCPICGTVLEEAELRQDLPPWPRWVSTCPKCNSDILIDTATSPPAAKSPEKPGAHGGLIPAAPEKTSPEDHFAHIRMEVERIAYNIRVTDAQARELANILLARGTKPDPENVTQGEMESMAREIREIHEMLVAQGKPIGKGNDLLVDDFVPKAESPQFEQYAFPVTLVRDNHDRLCHPDEHYPNAAGMTLRQYIAAAALQGVLAQPYEGTYNADAKAKFGSFENWQTHLAKCDAQAAVRATDALMQELKAEDPRLQKALGECLDRGNKILELQQEIMEAHQRANDEHEKAADHLSALEKLGVAFYRMKSLALKGLNALQTVDAWDNHPGHPNTKEMLELVRNVRAEIHLGLKEHGINPATGEAQIEITVNGRKVHVDPAAPINYHYACLLAGFKLETKPTITWYVPGATTESGSLLPNPASYVDPVPGMVLTVVNTNKA